MENSMTPYTTLKLNLALWDRVRAHFHSFGDSCTQRTLLKQRISFEMAGTKNKNVYRKKRKGKPFSGVQKQVKVANESSEIVDPTPGTSREICSSSDSEIDQPISASRKKMRIFHQWLLIWELWWRKGFPGTGLQAHRHQVFIDTLWCTCLRRRWEIFEVYKLFF